MSRFTYMHKAHGHGSTIVSVTFNFWWDWCKVTISVPAWVEVTFDTGSMTIYERLTSRMSWHEDCLRLGITNLVDYQIINVDQTTMTMNQPYLVVMAFEDVNSAVRWHDLIASWNIGGQIVPRYNPEQFLRMRPTILVEGDFDHAELMRCVRLELGVGWTPPHVDAGPIVASEVIRRCLYAQIIMHLKSLIPTMPVDQDQDLSFDQYGSSLYGDIPTMTICDGSRKFNLPLVRDSAVSIAKFTSDVSSVRWDKLDDFLKNCTVPPVFIDKTRVT